MTLNFPTLAWYMDRFVAQPYHPRDTLVASSHHFDSDRQLGVLRLWGSVDGRQLVDALRAFIDSPLVRSGFHILYDARDVEALDVTPDDVTALRDVADELRPRIGPGRSAILGHSEDVLTIGHLLKAVVGRDSEREVEVFADLVAACDWLGVDHAAVEPVRRQPQ